MSRKRFSTFEWRQPASEVFVSGPFDDWKGSIKLSVDPEFGHFEVTIELAPELGERIPYKFKVDGVWMHDPKKLTEDDGAGNLNNILISRVPKPLLPSGRTTSNATEACLSAYMEVCRHYNSGNVSAALSLAWDLYYNPYIPMLVRAGCCTFLATGDENREQFAQEAVELCEEMLKLAADNDLLKQMLAEAQELLADSSKDNQQGSQAEAAQGGVQRVGNDEPVEAELASDAAASLSRVPPSP